MLEVLNSDYIRTARAKGLPEHKVINYHAFRNILIPIVTLLGGTLPSLFSGALNQRNHRNGIVCHRILLLCRHHSCRNRNNDFQKKCGKAQCKRIPDKQRYFAKEKGKASGEMPLEDKVFPKLAWV